MPPFRPLPPHLGCAIMLHEAGYDVISTTSVLPFRVVIRATREEFAELANTHWVTTIETVETGSDCRWARITATIAGVDVSTTVDFVRLTAGEVAK